MSGAALAAVGFVALLALIALRMPIALAMLVVGAAGYALLTDVATLLNYIKTTPYHLFASYTLSVVPLFILMGALAERSGLAEDLFRAAAALVGRRPGGLAMAVIWAATAFGAICGSSVATTATFGRAALPQLRRYGYDGGVAAATVAVGGTLGTLIPPSVVLVVYAVSTEQNIVRLFLAALVPGLLAALFYSAAIALMARARPAAMPAAGPAAAAGGHRPALAGVWPAGIVGGAMLGGIYGGIFTPTEGAGVGCVLLLIVALLRRSISRRGLAEALRATAATTAMIFAIVLGAEVFNAFLALTQMPATAAAHVAALGLPPLAVVAVLLGFYILLGAVMDELAMILLTLPVFFPIVTALDLGLPADEVAIWFGILVLIVVGIGLVAPPIGLNVFVVSAIARDVPMTATYRAVLPFVAADLVRLALVLLLPGLSLALVRWLA